MAHPHRIFVLGAGFSCAAGLPLAVPLWKEIREIAERFSPDRREIKFNHDLENYIAFRKDAYGEELTADTVNFEDFIRYLDVEHYLALRGGDTWSTEGNEGTVVTKYLIGRILARQVNALDAIPDLYLEFARRLDVHDTVITFNYDPLLELALEAVGKPFRLFPHRYEHVGEFSNTVDSSRDEVVVLKMHGSIDWFDKTSFDWTTAYRANMGAPPPTDIIFSNVDELDLVPLTDGPRPDNDPLRNIYRAKNLRALYAKQLLFLATPRMLPPSNAKLLYSNAMHDFWLGMGGAGIFNAGMAIIGFSLPEQDDYVRQIIHSMVTKYQRTNVERDHLGRKKTPMTVVDFFSDEESETRFKERYRFVDWPKTHLFGRGFDDSTLDSIFATDIVAPADQ